MTPYPGAPCAVYLAFTLCLLVLWGGFYDGHFRDKETEAHEGKGLLGAGKRAAEEPGFPVSSPELMPRTSVELIKGIASP